MNRILAGTMLGLLACTGWAHGGEQEGRPHSHWWLELDSALNLSWYAGAGAGQSRFDGVTLANDGSFTSRSKDDTGTGIRLMAGMAIGKYVVLELGYADFGEASFRGQSDGSGAIFNAGRQSVTVEADGYDASLLGRLPLADDWGLFARVGMTWWESAAAVSVDAQCCGAFDGTLTDDGKEVTYGGGVQYDGLRPLRVIAEYGVLPSDIEFADDTTLDWMAISVAYLF